MQSLSRPASHCWIPERLRIVLMDEIDQWVPLETGGILLGYEDQDNAPVVTDLIGPGPRARHLKSGFFPDHLFQVAELDRRVGSSPTTLSYLGEWHSHPGGALELSQRDKRVLKRIAGYAPARVRHPIMLIVTESRQRAVWQFVGTTRRYFWPEINVRPLKCRTF